MTSVIVFGNNFQDNSLSYIEKLLATLCRCEVPTMVERSFFDYINGRITVPAEISCYDGGDPGSDTLALSIGGDGTFLRTAAMVLDYGLPVMGVNAGHLGYLSAAPISDVEQIVDHIVTGNYNIIARTMVEVEVPGRETLYGLNEVAVLKLDTASMITASTTVNGFFLANYQGDGLIVSTPTGSTGYAVSVGGPIVAPTAPVFVIAPVATHSLTMRPMVVSDSAVIEIMTTSREESFLLSVDGRSMSLPVATPLTIRKAPFVTKMVTLPFHNFAETLRVKLLWGVDPR
ncbi:MAG: NAD(+)/NADH kinase [Paramuribaculum sp.]|nr:NAD(+)/NADH kinase [Paramuribaculum sp.]